MEVHTNTFIVDIYMKSTAKVFHYSRLLCKKACEVNASSCLSFSSPSHPQRYIIDRVSHSPLNKHHKGVISKLNLYFCQNIFALWCITGVARFFCLRANIQQINSTEGRNKFFLICLPHI
jgi:hypothetical protein